MKSLYATDVYSFPQGEFWSKEVLVPACTISGCINVVIVNFEYILNIEYVPLL